MSHPAPTRSWLAVAVFLSAVLAVNSTLPSTTATAQTRPYRVVDLGLNHPTAINNRGRISLSYRLVWQGQGAYFAQESFAGIWEAEAVHELSAPADHHVGALGLNNRGEAVGSGTFSPFGPGYGCPGCPVFANAFLWTADGARVELPQLSADGSRPESIGAAGHAINDRGEIAGRAWYGVPGRGGWQKAVVWRHGSIVLIGPAAAFLSGAATDINDTGDVVGWAEFSAREGGPAPRHAFVLDGSSLRDLGTLAGPSGTSTAYAINAAGAVVGASSASGGATRGFVWQNGTMTELSPVGDDTDSEALAINGSGDIAGTSYKRLCAACERRAVIWRNGVATDLNDAIPATSGWRLSESIDIDDAGRVIGSGRLNGSPRFFVIDPAPATLPPPPAPPPCVAPQAPELAGAAVGTSVRLAWRPATTGGGPTRYLLSAGLASGRVDVAQYFDAATTELFVAAPPGAWFVRAVALNACGASAPSNEVVLIVGAPTILRRR